MHSDSFPKILFEPLEPQFLRTAAAKRTPRTEITSHSVLRARRNSSAMREVTQLPITTST